MGCCACVANEIRTTEIVNFEQDLRDEKDSHGFNDLSLSSDSEMPPLKEWIEFKNSKFLSESTDFFSSINYSYKKQSYTNKTFSNQGSIVDSFSVAAFPNSFSNK
jgi:hypothetical protein